MLGPRLGLHVTACRRANWFYWYNDILHWSLRLRTGVLEDFEVCNVCEDQRRDPTLVLSRSTAENSSHGAAPVSDKFKNQALSSFS